MKGWGPICFALAATTTWADEPARWYGQVDNDVIVFTDRWYTSGLRVARVQPRGDHALELGVVHEIHTPEHRRFELDNVDRVPAARLLLSAARHDATPRLLQTVELTAGVTGPAALGEEASKLIHKIIGARNVEWYRQGPNRFDGSLALARSHVAMPIAIHYGAVAGTQVSLAHAGFEYRSHAEGAFSPVARYAATPPPAAGKGPRWSGFAGANARGVLRNELLRDGYDPFAAKPARRHVIGRLFAGFAFVNALGSATFTIVRDSREFTTQRTEHNFASLTVHLAF